MEDRQLTHIDCFSGAGGFCTGLGAAGFKTICAMEYVDACVETYKANHPDVTIFHGDIRQVSEEDILKVVNGRQIDLVTSGMPCETFSHAGRTSRDSYDDRQYLFEEGIRIANIVNAKFLLFENVPGIATKKVSPQSKRLIIEDLYDSLEKAGYVNHIQQILMSSDYGVPQNRKRLFILATKDTSIKLEFPEPTCNNHITVRTALADLPPIVANSNIEGTEYLPISNDYTELMKNNDFWKLQDSDTRLTYHMPQNHKDFVMKRLSMLKEGQGVSDLFKIFSQNDIESLQKQRILPKKAFRTRMRRLFWDKPSATITSHCLDESVHPDQTRALSVRECARLQSFPDNYKFVGGPYMAFHGYKLQTKYEQVGDSVPPLLAYAIGKQIKTTIKNAK